MCLAIFLSVIGSAHVDQLRRFEGELILKALPDGREMELMRDFNYTDSQGIAWPVPAGARVAAPISSTFWSPSFSGKHREASVIHSYYCATRSRQWKAVHKMFLDGMIARGVESAEARLMYLTVYRFGPRWDFDIDSCFCKGCSPCANPMLRRVGSYRSPYNQQDIQELRKKAIEGQLSLEELESAADYQINTEILRAAR